MKSLFLIPFLLIAACASRPSKKVNIVSLNPSASVASPDGLRTGEQLREYRFGRYVDPGDPLVMHEGHPVYRVETSANWNLRSGDNSASLRRAIQVPASVSANDAVVAEVNKQRVATRAFTEQAATLNVRLGEMAQAASQTQELAKQNLTLRRDVAALRERLDALDSALREKKAAPADRTPRTEDKW